MIIDKEIKDAISRLVDARGNVNAVAQELGVKHGTVSDWLNGGSTEIRSKIWPRLALLLRPFLPPSDSRVAHLKDGVSDSGVPEDGHIHVPASQLKFVQALKKRPPINLITEAILAELGKMNDVELSMLLAELVQRNARKELVAADAQQGYSPETKAWLAVFPKMGEGRKAAAVKDKLKGAQGFKALAAGEFKWKAILWASVPKEEAAAFDSFLAECFKERDIMSIVERVLPLSGPYAIVAGGVGREELAKRLHELVPAAMKFHIMPYCEAAHSKCVE